MNWSKVVSLLAGLSLAFNSVVPSGAVALAYQEECSEANLIINGSFEDPVVDASANWDIFGATTFIPGWQADWRADVPLVWNDFQRPAPQIELQRGYAGWLTQDGSQITELDSDWDGPNGSLSGEPASIQLWQDINTVPGANYEIKFWTSPRPGIDAANNMTEAKFGSTVLGVIAENGTANTNTVWTEHIYTVAATAAVTRLMFTDLGTANSLGGFVDNVTVSRICEPEPDPCDFGDQTGWYGEYFNYSQNHPDMNLDSSLWPDKTHGDPMGSVASWTADWYTGQYFRFSRVDANLAFGGDFFPFDGTNGATPLEEDNYGGRDYHFGAHWSGKVTAPADGNYMFSLTTDDDAWVYLDGVLVADNSGIHPPASVNGFMALTTTPKILDVYFAERHVVQSHMYFSFTGDIFPQVVPYNRACPQPVPTLSLEKTGVYDPATGQIDYSINWNVTGEGTLYDVTITDTVPTGTTFVSADNSGTELLGVVTWLLDAKTAPASGTVHMIVSVNSYEPWADTVVDYNPGLQKGGGALPAERTDTNQALGADVDNDAAPINFVTLGFGGDLVLGFNNYILDGTGADIHVIETSWGNPPAASYPEKLEVLASQNGTTWASLGTQTRSEVNHDNDFDLSGLLPWAKYLKLVDKTDASWPGWDSAADGYDVAAVQALHSAPAECSLDNSAHITGLAYNQQPVTADASVTLTLNQIACAKDVTVVAQKIVCDSEADLPNWGNGGPDITADTAQNWVNSHQSCHFVKDLNFQWGPQSAPDPGDTLIGPAPAPWQTMPPTDVNGKTTVTLTPEDMAGSSYLWFREELQNGYIPFTHDQNNNTNVDNVSAEMYCHVDVLNYDNYDRIDGIELGHTYNCIGFNTPSTHTISGMKFNDHDGDGIKDGDDNGLAKWTIYASKFKQTIQVLAQNSLPTSPEFWTNALDNGKEYILRVSGTYDANDYITADAKYSMRSVNGPDWTDIVKNYEAYGPTLLDLFIDNIAPNWGVYNPSHIYWRTIAGTGAQVKLQISEIYAQNDSGFLTVDVYEVIDSEITDGDGNYHFTFPADIDIGGGMISEQTQSGWVEKFPTPDGYYFLPTNSNYTDKDFGNHYTVQLPGTVTGMKFNDHDGDGIKDANDGGLQGWKIYAGELKDTFEVNSYYEDPELPALANSIVLENGQKYFLRVSQTFLAGDSITADAKYSIRTGPDWTDLVENYGGWEPGLLELWMNSAVVNWGAFNDSHVYWHTVTGDGNPAYFHIKDIWPINNQGKLKVEVFKVVAEATTGASGSYTLVLPDELTGDVAVAEETQTGWTQTYPMPQGYHTASADGLTEGINFGNHDINEQNPGGGPDQQFGSISGMKFEDHNGDGVKDVNDGPLAGWTIYIDANGDGDLDVGEPTYLTLEDGAYQFINLSADTYVVREVGNNGWTQTYPATGFHSLVLGDGTWIWAGINFGNHEGAVESQGGGSGGGGGGGSSGGGGVIIPPTTPTGGSGGDEGGIGGGEVAGDETDNTGGQTGGSGDRQLALGTGSGDEGNLQDQGDVAGDEIANDQNNNDQTGGGWGGWRTFGIVSISLLLLLLIIYGIYRWMNRRRGQSA